MQKLDAMLVQSIASIGLEDAANLGLTAYFQVEAAMRQLEVQDVDDAYEKLGNAKDTLIFLGREISKVQSQVARLDLDALESGSLGTGKIAAALDAPPKT